MSNEQQPIETSGNELERELEIARQERDRILDQIPNWSDRKKLIDIFEKYPELLAVRKS